MERDVQQKMTGRHGAESEKIDTKKVIEADRITTKDRTKEIEAHTYTDETACAKWWERKTEKLLNPRRLTIAKER